MEVERSGLQLQQSYWHLSARFVCTAHCGVGSKGWHRRHGQRVSQLKAVYNKVATHVDKYAVVSVLSKGTLKPEFEAAPEGECGGGSIDE
jgi:hypothetical protein